MINVSEALDGDTAQPVIIERTTDGLYVDGLWKDGVTKKIRALASIQPNDESIEMGTDPGLGNQMTDETWTVYCTKQLQGSKSTKEITGDILIYRKTRYAVIGRTDWSDYGHCIATIAEIDDID